MNALLYSSFRLFDLKPLINTWERYAFSAVPTPSSNKYSVPLRSPVALILAAAGTRKFKCQNRSTRPVERKRLKISDRERAPRGGVSPTARNYLTLNTSFIF